MASALHHVPSETDTIADCTTGSPNQKALRIPLPYGGVFRAFVFVLISVNESPSAQRTPALALRASADASVNSPVYTAALAEASFKTRSRVAAP